MGDSSRKKTFRKKRALSPEEQKKKLLEKEVASRLKKTNLSSTQNQLILAAIKDSGTTDYITLFNRQNQFFSAQDITDYQEVFGVFFLLAKKREFSYLEKFSETLLPSLLQATPAIINVSKENENSKFLQKIVVAHIVTLNNMIPEDEGRPAQEDLESAYPKNFWLTSSFKHGDTTHQNTVRRTIHSVEEELQVWVEIHPEILNFQTDEGQSIKEILPVSCLPKPETSPKKNREHREKKPEDSVRNPPGLPVKLPPKVGSNNNGPLSPENLSKKYLSPQKPKEPKKETAVDLTQQGESVSEETHEKEHPKNTDLKTNCTILMETILPKIKNKKKSEATNKILDQLKNSSNTSEKEVLNCFQQFSFVLLKHRHWNPFRGPSHFFKRGLNFQTHSGQQLLRILNQESFAVIRSRISSNKSMENTDLISPISYQNLQRFAAGSLASNGTARIFSADRWFNEKEKTADKVFKHYSKSDREDRFVAPDKDETIKSIFFPKK